MNNHSKTLVPIEVWTYYSPDLIPLGMKADVGLFIEALLYYDEILLNISHPNVFSDLLNWFVKQHSFRDLLNLFSDGNLKIYDYAFASTAVEKDGIMSLWNMQDQKQSEPNTYEERILYSKEIESVLPHSRQRVALYKAVRDNIIEVKASEFGSAIENAKLDLQSTEKNNLLIQSFLDYIYKMKGLGKPPTIQSEVTIQPNGTFKVTYNVDIDKLTESIGKEIGFHKASPLTAIAHTNRLLQSASTEMSDLYLGSPISTLAGNKLYETNKRILKTEDTIQQLKLKVEFPDIRTLVNNGKISFQDIIKIREEAIKFRRWLQSEGERDRDAIIAYHKEVSEKTGISKGAKRIINVFGILGGGALGATVNQTIGGPLGGIAGAGASYLIDIATGMSKGWKPVIFGEWLEDRIKKIIK